MSSPARQDLTYVEMANAIRAAVSALSGGLPAGGSTGEVLTKASATDYDATWPATAEAILTAIA